MIRTVTLLCLFCIMFVLVFSPLAYVQNFEASPFTPGKDSDIDMYLVGWKKSMPRHSHGSLVERDILTRGDPLNPPRKGAVLKYANHFSYATLDDYDTTQPTTLKGEQEIIYINSGKGVIKSGKKSHDLYKGICALIPANLSFTITNITGEPLTMYLINEPIPEGFRPNNEILIRDENTQPIVGSSGHWCHIVKGLFSTDDGLGTIQTVIIVSFDPMTVSFPETHGEGFEEVWAQVDGTSVAYLGKQVRWQKPGMAFMVPPNGKTNHSNINLSDKQVKLFYFARYQDHEVRK